MIISIKIIYRKGGNKTKTPKINQRENYMKCRIQNNTNWEDFQKCLNEEFSRNNLPVNSNDINIIWETWKTNINNAATNAIGIENKVKNHKHIWDKELDGLTKSRKAANRLKRTHDATIQHDSELGKLLSESCNKAKVRGRTGRPTEMGDQPGRHLGAHEL